MMAKECELLETVSFGLNPASSHVTLGKFFFLFPVLLRHNWHLSLYKFKMYSIMV